MSAAPQPSPHGAVTIREVGPEAAAEMLDVVRAAFGARPALDPPTDALAETERTLADKLSRFGGLVADLDGAPVAAVVLDPVEDTVFLRRFGVTPAAQGHGVARRLVAGAADAVSRRLPTADRLVVLAREELPRTIDFWKGNGFRESAAHPPYRELTRELPRRYDVASAEDMRDLARRLAGVLAPGDVLVLTGELGAGKTTFTQGLGEGLGVRGPVTSPTFVIARVHPPLDDGPALVHVDAYRLDGAPELDDLDLDADLDRAVTVVEWGEGLAEALSDSPLHVRIDRAVAAPHADPEDDPRSVVVAGHGPRWAGVRLPPAASGPSRS